jgi:hypothetical protein
MAGISAGCCLQRERSPLEAMQRALIGFDARLDASDGSTEAATCDHEPASRAGRAVKSSFRFDISARPSEVCVDGGSNLDRAVVRHGLLVAISA